MRVSSYFVLGAVALCAIASWVACSDPIELVQSSSTNGVGGDVASTSGGQGGTNPASTSSSGAGGADSSSSSSGTTQCALGGDPCVSFSDCCSGTCASNVCTQCATTGTPCAPYGCCIGDICYNGTCATCSDNGANCNAATECCSSICSQGVCVPLPCAGGGVPCFNTNTGYDHCVDTQSDAENCGGCGIACGADGICCEGKCVDPKTVSNCGACGNVCAASAMCVAGQCMCPMNQTPCSGSCTNLSIDNANCGACGNGCGIDHYCSGGQCVLNAACCDTGINYGIANPLQQMFPPPPVDAIAWKFIPTCNMKIAAVEIFTTNGWLNFGPDLNGLPDYYNPFFQAVLPYTAQAEWKKASAFVPVQLVAGQVYWVWHMRKDEQTSISGAQLGVASAWYTRNSANGSWTNAGQRLLTTHVIGDCPP